MKEGPFILGITSEGPSKRYHQHTNPITHLKHTVLVQESKLLLPSIKQATMGTHTDPTDQWKLCSAQEALLLLIFAAVAIVGLCASATLRKKRILTEKTTAEQATGEETVSSWGLIKKVLISSLHWNEGTKRVVLENGGKSQEEMEIMDDQGEPEGWENSTMGLAVWQRRIIMGERCQLPKFSGLILYDENGRPLHNSSNKDTPHQVKQTPVVTTLKDLL